MSKKIEEKKEKIQRNQLEANLMFFENQNKELQERNHELQMQLHKSSTDVIYLKEAIRILVK